VRRANAQLQSDRRTEILKAAERCFARAGFHQASMHDICAEAGMSPGNLYRYFPSKEALIAGISERNRTEAAGNFARVNEAADFFDALAQLAREYMVERSDDEVGLCAEIMAETRRSPEIAHIYNEIEKDIKNRIEAMLRTAIDRGEVRADVDVNAAAYVLMALADGVSWRRAVQKDFDVERILPLILQMVHGLLAPQAAEGAAS
jgi:TetR/AcrR family transcriptional regulator, repressor for uid operon